MSVNPKNKNIEAWEAIGGTGIRFISAEDVLERIGEIEKDGVKMGRLKELRKYVNRELNMMEDAKDRISAVNHLYGVSLAATILAKKRGLDPELAAMAAMLHDLHAYKTGSYDDHAHLGAELARAILTDLGLTTDEETDIICSAIYHHDDKYAIDSPMDELLKDADVIHHTLNDTSKPVKEKEQARYDKIMEELGME